MSAKPETKLLTVAEYLALERAAEYKSDYIDGRLYPVHDPYRDVPKTTADGPLHAGVKANLVRCLFDQLRAVGGDLFFCGERIRVAPPLKFADPDIVLVGDGPEWDLPTGVLLNPAVVIEVVSDDTDRRDHRKRFDAYRNTPSILEVVFADLHERLLQLYVRQAGEGWSMRFVDDAEPDLVLTTMPVRVNLADVYRDVRLIRPGDPVPE